jgi:bifunctional DNase/RNase
VKFYFALEKLVKLNILSLTPSSFGSNSFILLLQDSNDATRMFPIVIGSNEAQAISMIKDDIKISRPLTHNLLNDLMIKANLTLEKVEIVDFKEGIFYSNMFFKSNENDFVLDARPSDAIAIALRSHSDVFISEELLKAISIPVDNSLEDLEENENIELPNQEQTLDELEIALKKALFEENYELAAQLRDSINKLK